MKKNQSTVIRGVCEYVSIDDEPTVESEGVIVRIEDDGSSINIGFEESGWTYIGRSIGEGHYEVRCDTDLGDGERLESRGTLHRFPNAVQLIGGFRDLYFEGKSCTSEVKGYWKVEWTNPKQQRSLPAAPPRPPRADVHPTMKKAAPKTPPSAAKKIKGRAPGK